MNHNKPTQGILNRHYDLVFHSFRHTAQDAFKNALTPQYVTDRIIGHAGGQVSDAYGEGVSLAVMQKAVSEMALPYDLSAALTKK